MSKSVQPQILAQFTLLQQMGSGAYGHVWQVQQKRTHKRFALKKVFDAFRNSIDAQRTYREVQILQQISHQNIIRLYRVMKSKNKKDLYLLFEYMQADLHSVVGSNILQKMHKIFVFYQVLKALKYLHSAELIHRDLKPSNVLLNSQCIVKICDFGLVRTLNQDNDEEAILSEEVATKWYRAPELLLGSRSYRKPIDLWSFGCIVAELLIGRPLFAGDSTLNQLQKIMEFTGNVSQQDLDALDSPVAQQLITQIKIKKKSFRQYFSGVDPDFWVLLKGTLQFNPQKRMTIDQVLALDLFNQFRAEINKLKTCQKPIKLKIDDNTRLNLKVYRDKIYEQIDRKNNSASVGQRKISQSENSINNLRKALISKKRVVSSPKPLIQKSLSRQKPRHPSYEQKVSQKSFSIQKRAKKPLSKKDLQSSSKLISPYKSQLLKTKPLHSTYSANLSTYYKKTIVPVYKRNIFVKNSDKQKEKNKQKDKQKTKKIQNTQSIKVLKKVTSATKFCKRDILKMIGFDK